MLTADVIRRVQRSFGDNNESQIYITDIIDWINDAQMEIVRQTKCIQKVVTFAVTDVTGRGPYALPGDFIYEQRVTYDDIRVKKTTLDALDDSTSLVDASVDPAIDHPSSFYIWGRDIYLFPSPKVASPSKNIEMWYVATPTILTTSADALTVPVNFHEDIVRFALMRARETNEDYTGADRLQNEFFTRMGKSRDDTGNPHDSYPAVRDYPADYYYIGYWV